MKFYNTTLLERDECHEFDSKTIEVRFKLTERQIQLKKE